MLRQSVDHIGWSCCGCADLGGASRRGSPASDAATCAAVSAQAAVAWEGRRFVSCVGNCGSYPGRGRNAADAAKRCELVSEVRRTSAGVDERIPLGRAGMVLPGPRGTIERPALYKWRYALNENVDGYTAPYWSEARWRHEIDVLALAGTNALLIGRGADLVLYQTFRDA